MLLEISSPFPASSRVTLSMKAGAVEVRAQGVVRVMHPDKGMGVEFTQTTPEHRAAVEKFLGVLTENRNLLLRIAGRAQGFGIAIQCEQTVRGCRRSITAFVLWRVTLGRTVSRSDAEAERVIAPVTPPDASAAAHA